MKLLLDPVYTTDIRKCASAFKYAQIWEHLSSQRDDLFAYWLIPKDISEEDRAWLQTFANLERVQFVEFNPHGVLDRYKHYMRLPFDLEMAYSFSGAYWDWDVLITNKAALVPLIRMMAVKPMLKRLAWAKKIVVLEDFPMMNIKDEMPLAPGDASDQQTLLGYLQSDATFLCGFWQRRAIMETARSHYAPSAVRQIGRVLESTVPRTFETVQQKSKATILETMQRKKPFTISFSGRMVKGHDFDSIFSVMEKQWIMRNDDQHALQCVITTASKGFAARIKPPKMVNIVSADREEFWDIVRNRADVGVFFSVWEDYSLSLIEPIALGLPVAVKWSESAESMLGPEYPFYVRNANESYGVVRAFYEDYAKHYRRFVEWQRTCFKPLLDSRVEHWIGYRIESVLQQWEADLEAFKQADLSENQFVEIIAPYLDRGYTMFEALNQRQEEVGDLRTFLRKVNQNQRETMRVVFSTDWNMLRIQLMAYRGYRDAGVQVGQLR